MVSNKKKNDKAKRRREYDYDYEKLERIEEEEPSDVEKPKKKKQEERTCKCNPKIPCCPDEYTCCCCPGLEYKPRYYITRVFLCPPCFAYALLHSFVCGYLEIWRLWLISVISLALVVCVFIFLWWNTPILHTATTAGDFTQTMVSDIINNSSSSLSSTPSPHVSSV